MVKTKKLECSICQEVGSLKFKTSHISHERQTFSVDANASGHNKKSKLGNKHFTSEAHKRSAKQKEEIKKNTIALAVEKINEEYSATTCSMFHSIYSLVKSCRPLSGIEGLIELQVKLGCGMGTRLHSRFTVSEYCGPHFKWYKTKCFFQNN